MIQDVKKERQEIRLKWSVLISLISQAQISRLPLPCISSCSCSTICYCSSFPLKCFYISTSYNPYSLFYIFTTYSLVDLCNYGGVDYKPSDGSFLEDCEDLPSTRSASLSSDISAFSSVTLLSTDELDRLLDDVRGLGDDTLQVKQVI